MIGDRVWLAVVRSLGHWQGELQVGDVETREMVCSILIAVNDDCVGLLLDGGVASVFYSHGVHVKGPLRTHGTHSTCNSE